MNFYQAVVVSNLKQQKRTQKVNMRHLDMERLFMLGDLLRQFSFLLLVYPDYGCHLNL